MASPILGVGTIIPVAGMGVPPPQPGWRPSGGSSPTSSGGGAGFSSKPSSPADMDRTPDALITGYVPDIKSTLLDASTTEVKPPDMSKMSGVISKIPFWVWITLGVSALSTIILLRKKG